MPGTPTSSASRSTARWVSSRILGHPRTRTQPIAYGRSVGTVDRRAVLRGVLGGAAAGALTSVSGCSMLQPGTPGVFEGTFRSAARGGVDTGYAVLYPPDTPTDARLPVVVCLHGKGGNHRDVLDLVDLGALMRTGTMVMPLAVASVDGGESYYHRRADGTDVGAMVTDELIPLLAARGLDTTRLGLMGWSMGGYGALLLTATTLKGAVRSVTTMSAALWESAGQSAPGAFDDARDFMAHDVFALRSVIDGVPLRVDCGTSDPFIAANRSFVTGFVEPPEGTFGAGGHTTDYWKATAPVQLAFASRHLGG